MSSKPKASEYKASAAEKTQASVSKAEKDYFNKTYAPLLTEMRDKAANEDLGGVARGVAGADTMQTLTGQGPSLGGARSVDESADLASAAIGQMAAASAQGLAASRNQQTNVLGVARGQAGEAMSGLAQASKIQNTKDLQHARANQQIREARQGAAIQVGTTLAMQGMKNKREGKSFFGGKDADNNKIDMKGRLSAGAFGDNPYSYKSMFGGNG